MVMVEEQDSLRTSETEVIHSAKSYYFLGSRTERVVFIFLLTFLSCAPIIFGKGIPSHADWHIHIAHAYHFKRCFWQGEFFPRWIDAYTNGYGLPIFNFYAPLVYYFFTLFELFFRDPVLSIKATFVFPMILCSVFGYLYLRRHSSPIATTLAMSFVIASPAIHIYTYNTNWPNSTLAIAFVFLTLYGIDSFDKDKNFDLKSLLITSIGFGGMALTHLATAFVFIILAIPYFFLSLLIYRTKKFVKNFSLSLILGSCLSAFYLFPAILEKNLIVVDEVMTKAPLWDYSKNFLYTYLDRHRDDGYAWAIFDHRYYEVSNALFGLAVLICIVILLLNIEKVERYFPSPFRINIAITMFIISFLMMTPLSIFIWLMIKPMHTIQFPWRFTTFILPFGALIMAYTFDLVGRLSRENINLASYRFLFYSIMLIFALLVYVDFVNVYRWRWMPEETLLKAAVNVLWGSEEYRPSLSGNPDLKNVDFKKDFSPTIQSTNSYSNITLKKWLSSDRIFEVFSPEEHQIRLRNFYFPGWVVYIDNVKTSISIDEQSNSIVFQVPSGQHIVRVRFELTPLRKISLYVSFVALFLYVFLFLKLFPRKNLQIEAKSL